LIKTLTKESGEKLKSADLNNYSSKSVRKKMNDISKDFFKACQENDINVSIARGTGNIVYRLDGDTIKPTMVSKLVKLDIPKGFVDWFKTQSEDEKEVTWIDEATTWDMIKPVFSVSKGGNIKMDARPSWDAALAERYDKGNYDVTYTDLELSVATMYEVMANTKKCRFVISKELFVKKLQGRYNAKKYDQRKDIANMLDDVFDWESESRTKVTRQQLYNLYRSYCRNNGFQSLNADNFKTSLKSSTYRVKYQHRSGQHFYFMPNVRDAWSYLIDPVGKTNLQEVIQCFRKD
jgi:hypothetical protein